MTIRVFYEDQAAAGSLKEFGPHKLVCALVADRMASTSLWALHKRIDGQPKKGDAKLLAACERHAARDREGIVFALFDGDRLHRVLGLPKDTTPEVLREAIEHRLGSSRVRPFVLPNNLEQDVVPAVARCLEPPVEGPIPKRHNERDRILNRAATHGSRSVRDCIADHVPVLGALADAIAQEARTDEIESALQQG